MILDTGSITNLLITDRCTTTGCKEHKKYKIDTEKNTSIRLFNNHENSNNNLKQITYGSGHVIYKTYHDSFWIGGLEVENQGFGGVVDEKGIFEGAAFDGLLGIAYPQLGSQDNTTPIFDSIIKNKLLEHNVFGLFVSRSGYGTSRFWLGGVNKGYIKDDKIDYHDVILKKWWTLKLDNVLVDGKDTNLCSPDPKKDSERCGIIMDSGTSNMAAPSNSFDKFKKLILQNTKGNDINSWPNVTLVINGINYTLDGHEIVTVNDNITYQKEVKKTDILELSWEPFGGGDTTYNIWIAGDTFLSKFITIYDRDNDRVGIAEPNLQQIKKLQSEEVTVNYQKK